MAAVSAAQAWKEVARDPCVAGTGAPVDLGPPLRTLHAAGASLFAGEVALRLRQQQLARALNRNLWTTPEARGSIAARERRRIASAEKQTLSHSRSLATHGRAPRAASRT